MNHKHKYTTRSLSGKLKRKNYNEKNNDSDSDSESNSEYDSDSDSIFQYDTEYDSKSEYKLEFNNKLKKQPKKINKLNYYKFLNKLFPSTYSKDKINKVKRQRLLNLDDINNDNNINFIVNDNSKSFNKIINNNDNDNNSIISDYDEYDNEYDNDNDNDNDNDKKNKKKQVIKILLKLLKQKNKNKLEDEDSNKEDSGEEDSSEEDSSEEDSSEEDYNEEYSNKEDSNKEDSNKEDSNKEDKIISDANKKNKEARKLQQKKNKVSVKNYKTFCKILDIDDNEPKYFKNMLSNEQQISYIEKLKKINSMINIDTPYLIHLLNIDIPDIYKACALRKINMLKTMNDAMGGTNGEFYKIKSWIDTFIKIPFNKYNNLEITFSDGIEKCNEFMKNAKEILDNVVYGLDDAKLQILQMIGLWLVNPNAIGTSIAIKGPPGTGKTTLIKEGISKILNRPFGMIALGGCGDSGFLEGHDYTYEGSKYGKIIDILIKAKCMNPIILFDELDKISDTPRGAEITGILTHLTDTTQNNHFNDKYMSEIDLDMSRALFIFSYNDEKMVNPILKDRLYKIETSGYKLNDKKVIANKYLLPTIRDKSKFNDNDIIIDDNNLEYIINEFTEKEAGVRNLKRCLETIYTKLNLYRLMKNDTDLFKCKNMIDKDKIVFPLTINKQIIDKLLIKNETNNIPFGMYN